MEEELYKANSETYAKTEDVSKLTPDSAGRVIFRANIERRGYHYVCKTCGAVKYIRPSDIDRGRGVFCSNLCFYSARNPYLTKNPKATQSKRGMPVDLTSSPTLAYLLGVIIGDGNVNIHNTIKQKYKGQRRNIIRMNVVSYEFAKSFFDALRVVGLNPCIFIREGAKPNHHAQWCVGGHSFTFALFYQKLREDLEKMKKFILGCPNGRESFIRGFYESEGSYYTDSSGWGGKHLTMSNTDKNLVNLVVELLTDLCFYPCVYWKKDKRPNRKGCFEISIPTKEQATFIELIKPCIKNKR